MPYNIVYGYLPCSRVSAWMIETQYSPTSHYTRILICVRSDSNAIRYWGAKLVQYPEDLMSFTKHCPYPALLKKFSLQGNK